MISNIPEEQIQPNGSLKIPKSCWFIILGVLLVNIGNYLVIPYFAVYLQSYGHFSLPQIGIVLSALMLGEKGFSIFSGHFSDKFSLKKVMTTGLVIRMLAYISVPAVKSFDMLIIISFFMGLGGSLYAPAAKKSIISCTGKNIQLTALSYRNIAVNVGTILGPGIGLLTTPISLKYIFYIAGGIYFTYTVLSLFFIPNNLSRNINKISNFLSPLINLVTCSNIRDILLSGSVLLFFYLQLILIAPIYINTIYGHAGIAAMFIINACIVIGLSLTVTRKIVEIISVKTSYIITGVLMTSAFLLISISANKTLGILSISLFTLGECILFPALNKKILSTIPTSQIGAAFGVMDFCAFTGSLIINIAGMHIYKYGQSIQHSNIYWLFCSFIGLIFIILNLPLNRNQQSNQHQH